MTFPEIENILLLAPLRNFKHFEVRGYFAPELKKEFGLTEEQLTKMLKMKSVFRWKLLNLNGERKYFFFLK